MRHRRTAFAAPSVLLAVLLPACSAEHAPPAEASGAQSRSATQQATPSAVADARRWLPPAAAEGALPRTLAGYTLLDPQPDGAAQVTGPAFGAAQQLRLQRDGGDVRVLSFDGRIFRIEYTLPQGVAFDSAAQSARDAYGEPSDDSRTRVQYGDSLKVGDTILEVRKLGERVQVFIEDAGTSLKAHSAS